MTFLASTPGTRLGAIGALGLALAWTALSFGAVTAPAAAQNPSRAFYRAVLAEPASEARAVAGDLVWACKGTSCVADKGSSRPLRICREVNRKFGQVVTFTANGEELSADDLAKCNG
jgi:hypothetical protein